MISRSYDQLLRRDVMYVIRFVVGFVILVLHKLCYRSIEEINQLEGGASCDRNECKS